MRRLPFRLFALGFLVFVLAAQTHAWEFNIRSEAEWRYRYFSRTGPNDLFGNAEIAQNIRNNGTSIGFAGPNAFAVRLEGFSSKGSDAAYGIQRWWVFPEFRINQAIRLRSVITFQGNVNANYLGGGANWATNPHYSGWIMIDSRDLYSGTGLAVPVLRAVWATAQTPLGIIVIGRRPGGFGLGWALHQDDSCARSLSLIAPYGPLTFIYSQYLHSGFENTDPNDDRNTRQSPLTIASGIDQNEAMRLNCAAALTYKSGSIDTGALLYLMARQGQHYFGRRPFAPRDLPTTAYVGTYQDDRSSSIVQVLASAYALNTVDTPIYIADMKAWQGIAYLKYGGANLSFNAEFDFLKVDMSRNGGRPITGFGTGWALEGSLYLGPTKVSLAQFYKSGHDRRGGYLNLSHATGRMENSFVGDRLDRFFSFLGGGEGPINPYTYLMSIYGTGNNSYSSTGSCTFDDFVGYAARLDHSVAANLNIFASALVAYRASNTATPQGFYNGTWAPNVAANLEQANSPGQGTIGGNGIWPWTGNSINVNVVPNVPEDDLGWEVNAGCSWKLLENMTFNFLYSYWQPGKWFNWAYRDMTASNPATFQQGNPNTITGLVNPWRTIDPIMGIQASLLVDF